MIDNDTALAKSAETTARLSNGRIDEALEAAYTLNWYLSEAWGDPAQLKNAQEAQLRVIDALTSGAYGKAAKSQPDKVIDSAVNYPDIKVAVVVGHNSTNKGAFMRGAFNEFEYDFNNRVAELMVEEAKGSPLKIKRFNRDYTGSYNREIDRVYSNVNSWEPDFIFELHFNGYNGEVGYSSVLHHYASNKGKACASHINDIFVSETGFDDNGTSALGSSDRGYLSTAKAIAPCILTETWFGDFPEHVEKIGELGHSGVADLYMQSIPGIAKLLAD